MTIWKYPLSVVNNQILSMPTGAKILCVQTQRETPVLYAEVDPQKPTTSRYIEIYGTGHRLKYYDTSPPVYIGTFQLRSGDLVFHVYERLDLP